MLSAQSWCEGENIALCAMCAMYTMCRVLGIGSSQGRGLGLVLLRSQTAAVVTPARGLERQSIEGSAVRSGSWSVAGGD